MTRTEITKKRILTAALKEFSTYGYLGARMQKIAGRARVNKAMPFYYFNSKRHLYETVLDQALNQLFPRIVELIKQAKNPENLFSEIPRIYIDFFSRNPDYVKMVVLGISQEPGAVAEIFKKHLALGNFNLPTEVLQRIGHWQQQEQIGPDEPVQLVLNVMGPILITFIALPMVQEILGPITDAHFFKKRIQSIQQLLKEGIIK